MALKRVSHQQQKYSKEAMYQTSHERRKRLRGATNETRVTYRSHLYPCLWFSGSLFLPSDFSTTTACASATSPPPLIGWSSSGSPRMQPNAPSQNHSRLVLYNRAHKICHNKLSHGDCLLTRHTLGTPRIGGGEDTHNIQQPYGLPTKGMPVQYLARFTYTNIYICTRCVRC